MLQIKKIINNVVKFQRNSALILTFVYILLSFSIIVPLLFIYGGNFLALNENNNGTSISKIVVNTNEWNTFNETITNVISFNSKIEFSIEDIDELLPSEEIYYYINKSNTPLTEAEMLAIPDYDINNENSWQPFVSTVNINKEGFYIIYAKVIDASSNSFYSNTDILVLNGYTQPNIIVGKNATSYVDATLDITNKSTITLNALYTKENATELIDYTHNLKSNILLPLGTKITLVDHITNKTYQYIANDNADILNNYNLSCNPEDLTCVKIATYPLTLFSEVGTGEIKLFTESTYYNVTTETINENWTIVLDLSSTSITENYLNTNMYMELLDTTGVSVRTTLPNELKNFDIYSAVGTENSSASLYMNTSYNGNEILLNNNSSTDVNINSGITYKQVDEFTKITDTTYENKEMGIAIKFVDSAGNSVGIDYLKNIAFKMDDVTYYPEKDKIVRIKLNNKITDISKILTINTYKNNINLEEGTYYIKIYNYTSFNGSYYDDLNNSVITIPISVLNDKANASHEFDVIMEDANRIIQKAESIASVPFNILVSGESANFNIRVSLYKKNELTAYNQDYTLVDLSNYTSDILNVCAENIYYVSTSPVKYVEPDNLYNNFNLNLITANLEYHSYKLVFDLYDGEIKMSTIEKYFIVR